ncbi:MAG TPA: DnaB-like helicase C-terminal domain-containing protein [Candidatus Eremiobacteraeota bacterium]|nr:MAG: hypothetical protein BWY64_00687 [bacterium ADurb.Bin363]HPZ07009.1 DnaB-like helicase C-terminal domain-containing protein [Candidatus Eremiobacteraeota bacterium]
MDKVINNILSLFHGRTDRIGGVARGRAMHFKILNPLQEIPRYLQRHLKGHQRIGFYNFLPDGTCHWGLVEFEKRDQEKKNLEYALLFKKSLLEWGIKAYIEKSHTDTGYRVWIFFDRPTDSTLVREALKSILSRLNFKEQLTIYPTEESNRAEEGLYGEFTWLPFFGNSDIMGKGVKYGHTLFIDDSKKVIPLDISLELIKTNDPKLLGDIIHYISEYTSDKELYSEEKEQILSEEKSEEIEKKKPSSGTEIEINNEMNDSALDNLLVWLISETFSPVPTGFRALDAVLEGGLQNGKITEIRGGNSIDRTSFALQIIDQIASYNSTRQLPVIILYISRRYDREELILKSISRIGELNENLLESKKWKQEANADEFIEHIHGAITVYQSFAQWIKVLMVKNKLDVVTIENTARQLSYKFNTPHILIVMEDPFFVLTTQNEKIEYIIKIQSIARQMNIPVIITHERYAEKIENSMDGMIPVSIELNTDQGKVTSLIKDKKNRCAIKLEEVKEELKKSEKPVILSIYKEKTDATVMLPYLMRRVYNQFIEL